VIFNADYSLVIGGNSAKEYKFIAAFIQLILKHNIDATLIKIDEVSPGSIVLLFSTSNEPVAKAILALFTAGNLVVEVDGETYTSTSVGTTTSSSTASGLRITCLLFISFLLAFGSWAVALIVLAIIVALVLVLLAVIYTRSRRQANLTDSKATSFDDPKVVVVEAAVAKAEEESSIMFIKGIVPAGSLHVKAVPEMDGWNPFQAGLISAQHSAHPPSWASAPEFWV
jgi:hypothetical protein